LLAAVIQESHLMDKRRGETGVSTIKPPAEEQQLAELVGRSMTERDRTAQSLGIRLVQIRPGYARLEMTVRADMTNHNVTCHGGFIFLLADAAFAFACNSHNHTAVAAACTIDFLAPAYEGDLLIAEAIERHALRRSGVYDVTVANSKGQQIALFRGKSQRIGTSVVDIQEQHA
jgi:acyl-CoA thioesterase